MKDFLKFTFASVIGVILAGVVFTILGIITLVGIVASSDTETVVKDNSIFVLDFKGSLSERVQENPLQQLLGEEFEAYGSVTVATEDGSVGTKGNVLDAIRENDLKADVIYACGPTPMLRALKAYSQEKGILCYLSLEEKMACGIGACLACTCQTKDVDEHSQVHNKRICKDGPVFLAEDIEL